MNLSVVLHYRLIRIVLAFTFFAIIFLVVWAFLALLSNGTPTVTIEPDQSNTPYKVWIDGESQWSYSGETLFTLRPGSYEFRVFSVNFQPLQKTITLEQWDSMRIDYDFIEQQDLYQMPNVALPYRTVLPDGDTVLDNQHKIFCKIPQNCYSSASKQTVLSAFPYGLSIYNLWFAQQSQYATFMANDSLFYYDIQSDRYFRVMDSVLSYVRGKNPQDIWLLSYNVTNHKTNLILTDIFGRHEKVFESFKSAPYSRIWRYNSSIVVGVNWLSDTNVWDVLVYDTENMDNPIRINEVRDVQMYQDKLLIEENSGVSLYTLQGEKLSHMSRKVPLSQIAVKGNILYYYRKDEGIFAYDMENKQLNMLFSWAGLLPPDLVFYDIWSTPDRQKLYFLDTQNKYYFYKLWKNSWQ